MQVNQKTTWLVLWSLIMIFNVSLAERIMKERKPESFVEKDSQKEGIIVRVIDFIWQSDKSSYEHVWPVSSILQTIFH